MARLIDTVYWNALTSAEDVMAFFNSLTSPKPLSKILIINGSLDPGNLTGDNDDEL